MKNLRARRANVINSVVWSCAFVVFAAIIMFLMAVVVAEIAYLPHEPALPGVFID